jgi:hypothetical protein
MRKIAASYIIPVSSKPIKQGIITISEIGEIIDVVNTNNNFTEQFKLEYYNGIIIPMFINCTNGEAKLLDKFSLQNVFSEIKKNSNISLLQIIEENTLKKAIENNVQNLFGSFENKKKPGGALITNVDFDGFLLTDKSEIRIIF